MSSEEQGGGRFAGIGDLTPCQKWSGIKAVAQLICISIMQRMLHANARLNYCLMFKIASLARPVFYQ